MGYLTTHILDTTKGIAAENVAIRLFQHTNTGQRQLIHTTISNHDGRCDSPLLEGSAFIAGVYELEFDIDAYFANQGIELEEPNFLNTVVIRFGIHDESTHYHIPLLVSPYSYSTYRGS
ncbi:hydroxyisourate hydrolase [Marinomonas sp. C2222]|uniref:5-hydroxyisourate hydrolase n=1 Tax=Marinomonas sargassi TaxID=2984494 RepID=A0ABT2YTG8_9GAMM|nr:hydroxyisourate hydrolase [Marinomonas sargassi]MCV2403187.1 hydroxyisourate hydrolase [Marinomonas sargassi]